MDTITIKKKIVSGFLSLTFRRAALLALNFFTINIILARILPVSTIGIFNIANSILAFFTFFSDIGLAAALIQKKQVLQDDLKTTFTIQEIIAFLITSAVFILAPTLASFYQLDEGGMWLIRALAVSFFLVSLKVVPSVLLERNLNFQPLVSVEILETIIFNGLLILFTFSNFGIFAFSIAALSRAFLGMIMIYIVAPWKISVGISRLSAKSLLNFGLPYQLNSILALLKDKLVPLVVAKMVGPTGVGFITWSQSLVFLPLEVMNIMIRVTFPAFSRLQDNPRELKKTLEEALFFTALILYPMLFGLIAIAPSFINYVVSPKWQSALPLIYLFSVGYFFATFSSPFTNFLNATGRIGTTLKLMVMWTALEWILSPLLSLKFGFLGVGIASVLIAPTSLIPFFIIKKIIDVEIIKNISRPVIAASIMAVLAYFLSQLFVSNFISLIIVILISALVYLGLVSVLVKGRVFKYFTNFKNV